CGPLRLPPITCSARWVSVPRTRRWPTASKPRGSGWTSARSSPSRRNAGDTPACPCTPRTDVSLGLSTTGRLSTPSSASSADCRPLTVLSAPYKHSREISEVEPMAALDREKALELALAQVEKQYGKGSVMRLGDEERAPIQAIPTGAIALDVALGIGGLPRGRVVEIYGPESSGKTTVALHAVANAQADGGIAAFIDAEHALDPEYAKKLGVDTDALLVSQPDTGEQALEIADMLIRSG